MFIGFRNVTYPVSNIDQASAWYAKALGISPHVKTQHYTGFRITDFELGLIPHGKPDTSGPQALWLVDDAVATYDHLIKIGAEPLDPVVSVGPGAKVGAVKDPFGNRFAFVQYSRGRGVGRC